MSAVRVVTSAAGVAYTGGPVTGKFAGTTNFGSSDFFISALNTNHDIDTTLRNGPVANGINLPSSRDAVSDSAGDMIVSGYGQPDNSPSSPSSRMLRKYDSSGSLLWSKNYAPQTLSSNLELTQIIGLARNVSQSIVGTGLTDGTLDGNALKGYRDAVVSKFDLSGNLLWTKTFGASGAGAVGNDTAVDAQGNIFWVGYAEGDIGGNPPTTSSMIPSAVLMKLDSNGNPIWKRQFGPTTGGAFGGQILLDSAGNITVLGSTYGAFGGTGFDGDATNYAANVFVAKFDASGTMLGVKYVGKKYSTQYNTFKLDSRGRLYSSGITSLALGASSVIGVEDVVIRAFDDNGALSWEKQYGMPNANFVNAYNLAFDANDNLILNGASTAGNPICDPGVPGGVATGYTLSLNDQGALRWKIGYGFPYQSMSGGPQVANPMTGTLWNFGYMSGSDRYSTGVRFAFGP